VVQQRIKEVRRAVYKRKSFWYNIWYLGFSAYLLGTGIERVETDVNLPDYLNEKIVQERRDIFFFGINLFGLGLSFAALGIDLLHEWFVYSLYCII
jgi:hypothetical protein